MWKIYNCVLYNTDKAKKIASFEYNDGDEETLYLGKNKYFLGLSHNENTRRAYPFIDDELFTEFETIDPIKALEWATKHLTVDDCLKHFEYMIEEA